MESDFQCRRAIGKDALQNVKHSHNAVEILFAQRGCGAFTVGEHIYPLSPNCIYFIGANTLHFSAPAEEKVYMRSVVGIPAEYFSHLCEITGYADIAQRLQERCCVMLDAEAAVRIGAAMERMQSDVLRDRVRALLDVMEIADSRESSLPVLESKISEIMAYINRNIGEVLTLDEIAAHMFIGKYYMCHLFKKTTGMSIAQYILLQRLSLCKRLLLSTDKSISEIAMLCGFSSFSYFCRAFDKSEGMSAGEYRKKFSTERK